MRNLPQARNADIITQSAGKEVLIYDLMTHKAYCLNETLSIVYQACDGKISFDELKAKTDFTDEIIFLALDELKKEEFINESEEYSSPFAGMSRREVIRKVGLASMIALPVISSLVAPTAAQSASIVTCRNVCVRANQNICAGCDGQSLTLTAYNSNDGSCTGGARSTFPFNCANGASLSVNNDYFRS